MAESKIKAEGESNDISAGKQVLEVDEANLKGKETYKCWYWRRNAKRPSYQINNNPKICDIEIF